MPEGDTIHRAADTMRRALRGARIDGFDSPLSHLRDVDLEGRTVTDVEARGKHLLIHFDDGRCLRTHMRMSGSWHLYAPGEAWRKPARQARVTLRTEDRVAVCFNAPDVELARSASRSRARGLGPDLLDPEVTPEAIVERWQSRPRQPIGVTVMRQHLAAGIGNVYKSEVLFLERVNPFVATGTLASEDLLRVARTAQRLLRENLSGGPRTTRRSLHGPRAWVYGRSGKPCLDCRSPIRMRRQGVDGRSTYYCPRCQGVSETPSSESSAP